jgi:rod shape-determining protein MreC
VAIVCIVFEHQQYAAFLSVRNFLSNCITPLHYIADSPIYLVRSIGDKLVSQSTLLQENAALKVKQTLLEASVLRLAALEAENAELQSLSGHPVFQTHSFSIARVLAVDSTVYLSQSVINQGLAQGVFVGQIVADHKGILGQVIQVGVTSSRIQLITDTASGVPVQLLRNGIRGIAVGEGSRGHLMINYVPITADIAVGDDLVTSGLGGHFPAQYPLARVKSVHIQPGDTFLQVEAVPTANVMGANFVLLLSRAQTKILKNSKRKNK